ncbi:MAG: histidine phosphatase family protein [Acidobacteria bacterium]|nr:histidine phosphatase family protein [Acidobacteriota bacterium]
MHTLILLRHGQSEWNKSNQFTGWYDCDLTSQGEQEAKAAASLLSLAEVLPDVVHTSLQRRAIRNGRIQHYRLERGLKLLDQFRVVVRAFRLRPGEARCSVCNGVLDRVTRAQVADRVPAKSLLWAMKFLACVACGKAYWNGSHWRRIEAVRAEMERMVDALSDG